MRIVGMVIFLTDYSKVESTVKEIKEKYSSLVCDVASINSPKQFLLSGELEVLNEVLLH